MPYPIHPAADYLPRMTEDEFSLLKQGIERDGLLNPIVLCDGQVLDGRHRYRACTELGVQPTFVQFVGGNPYDYVREQNVNRRHFASQEQKYLVLLRLTEASETWAEERARIQREANAKRAEAAKGNDNAAKVSERNSEHTSCVRTVSRPSTNAGSAAVAAAAGVNRGAVQRGEYLAKNAPELAAKVMAGDIAASAALATVKIAKLKEETIRRERDATYFVKPVVECCDAIEWLRRQEPCDLLLTDPPYMTDVDDIRRFAAAWLPLALSKVKDTGRAYVFIGAYPEELHSYLSVAMPEQVLVWTYRNTLGPAPAKRYKQNWQAILYYQKPEAGPLDCPQLSELFSVQDVNAPDGRLGDRYHAWQKPMELAERLVRHAAKSGDTMLDPFCCTGTFLIAAAKYGLDASGCDSDSSHLQIAAERGCVLG